MHGTHLWHSSGLPGKRDPAKPVALCRVPGIKFLFLLFAIPFFAASSIQAASTTFRLWDNGGGDGLWSTSANWSNNNVPNTSTEVAEFGSTAPNAISQDVSALTVGELLFDSGGIARNITGSAITLSGISSSGIINNSSSLQTIGIGITLGSAQIFDAGTGGLSLSGNINNNGKALTVQGSADTAISGVISGSGSLTKSGTGILTLSTANTYSGTTTISGGQIRVTADSALGTTTATTVNSGGTLSFSGGFTYSTAESLTLNGTGAGGIGALYNAANDNSFAGPISLASATTIGGASGTTLTLSGVLSGSGALTYAGPGTLLLTGNNTYTGTTTITGGILEAGANNALGSSASGTTVSSGGTLAFTGGITYSTAESVTLNGTGAGGAGALYNASGNNSFAGPISLATASTISSASGTTLTLSGVMSGSGALTKDGPGTLLLTGNNTYSGSTLVSAGYLSLGANNALGSTAGGTTVSSGAAITMAGGINYSSAESLTLNGTGVLGTEGAFYNVSGNNSFAGSITLGSSALITSASGTLTLSGAINNSGNTLSFGGAGNVTANGIISGSGAVTKNDGGTLTLGAANTFTGPLTINGGTVQLGSSERIADTVAVGVNGGTLALSAFNETIGSLSMTGGSITGSGTLSLGGDVTGNASASSSAISPNVNLGGATRTFTIADGVATTDMRITGSISSGGIIKEGAGTLSLGGSSTYASGTTVNAGTLVMGVSDALGTGALSINSGATVQANFSGTASTLSGISLSSGTLSRTATSGSDTTFASSIGITSTGTSTLRDSGGDTGGGLVIGGAVNVNSGTLTIDATTSNDSIQLSSGQNLNIAAGAAVATTGSGTKTIGRTIVGNGTAASESTITLGANTAYNASTAVTVNGSGTGGLRVEGAGSDVDSLLNSTRLTALSGTGGTLTFAYNDGASGTVSSKPLSASNVKLGFDGSGSYTLGASANDLSTYNGLVVKGGTVQMGVNETFVGQGAATLELNGGLLSLVSSVGFPRTLEFKGDATLAGGSLKGSQTAGAQAGTLTVGGNLTSSGTAFLNTPNITMSTISGTAYVQGSTPLTGIGTFTKTGGGTLQLNNSVSASSINLTAGTLLLGQSGVIGDTTSLNLSGGATFATGGFNEQLGSLTLANNSYIDLGSSSSVLQFADSSSRSWTGGTLTIRNWSGSIAGNGADQILFGSSSGALSSSQVAQIFFENPDGLAPGIYPAMMLPWGEVVPIPEANTWATAALLGLALAARERKSLLLLGQKLHQIAKVLLRQNAP